MKQIPKGAITSPEEIAILAGKPVWQASPTHSHSVDGGKHTVTGLTGIEHIENFNYYFYEAVGLSNIKHSLKDMNIPLNSYNDWFLFANREDAAAYLGRAQ